MYTREFYPYVLQVGVLRLTEDSFLGLRRNDGVGCGFALGTKLHTRKAVVIAGRKRCHPLPDVRGWPRPAPLEVIRIGNVSQDLDRRRMRCGSAQLLQPAKALAPDRGSRRGLSSTMSSYCSCLNRIDAGKIGSKGKSIGNVLTGTHGDFVR